MMAADASNISSHDRLLQQETLEDELVKPKTIPISTKYGYMIITQQGPPNRPVIVTFHDIGYNSTTQFHDFFALPEMMPITKHFTIYHINAPGQDEQANPLPTAFVYPSMDQLAVAVNDVFVHLDIKSAIGFGIGLGANVLARFAIVYDAKIYGLIMINCIARSTRWLENFSAKRSAKDSSQQHWTETLLNHLLWYHLGPETQASDPELASMLRRHFEEEVKAKNVIKLLNSFLNRTAIPIDRQGDSLRSSSSSRTFKCAVLNVTGATSPHKEDVMDTNERCNPLRTSYVEVSDCGGSVLLEQPSKLAESIRLFLQGLGYMSHLSIPQYSTSNRLAEQAAAFKEEHGEMFKVPRRLSTQVYFGSRDEKSPDEDHQRTGSFSNRNTKF